MVGRVETLSGFDVSVTENPLQINGANVVDADILACNGIIHVIDDVLIPGMPITILVNAIRPIWFIRLCLTIFFSFRICSG